MRDAAKSLRSIVAYPFAARCRGRRLASSFGSVIVQPVHVVTSAERMDCFN